jgi:NAD(P)-dependent dehydrogenase (short-subunit alcohol dehydrogenase family)
MNRLEGKTALITGGTSGIGLAAPKEFVNEGAYSFIMGRREAALAAALKEIGRNVTSVQGDVSSLGDLDHLYAQSSKKRGLAVAGWIHQPYSTAFCEITSRYHSALSFGVRFCVLKST